jgi:hypothetical protein
MVWHASSMMIISVLYPVGSDDTFDMDYYMSSHVPLVQRLLEPMGMRQARVMKADSDAAFDWASIVGFVTGVLGWFVPGLWLLGIIFGAIGMKRTKDGSLRGRGLAVAGFVLGVAVPLVVILLIGVLLAAV